MGLIVAAVGLVPAAAQAAASLRIVRPANNGLVNGQRMRMVVAVPAGATRFRVTLEGRDVTRRFHARGGKRVGTLTGVRKGGAHLAASARVRGKERLAFARVFARTRRDPSLLRLLNADATLLREASDEGVARLAIRTRSDAILRATLNGHMVVLGQDRRTGNRLAAFNRADGLRRGRNTLRLVAFTRDGRYDTLTRGATISRSAPMAVAGHDRRVVVGQRLRLDGRRSVPGHRGQRLTYRWRVVRKPSRTAPRLRGRATARPRLRVRQPGRYVLAMTVSEQQPDGTLRRSTDLLETTAAPASPPAGAPIDTVYQQGGQTGIWIGSSPPRFLAGPPSGQLGVYGFDPKTLQTDRDLNTVLPNSGDLDSSLEDAVSKFAPSTIVVLTASSCCSASKKLLPQSGAFSYITRYSGDKNSFGQAGTWNRNLALTDEAGDTHPNGALTGVLRSQPSDGGAFRFIQDGRVPYSTSVPTESTLGPADGATYRILGNSGNAVDVPAGEDPDGEVGLGARAPSSALTQQWELRRAYGDYYRIVNLQSGLCMNLSGTDSLTVLQWACTGADAPNELWFLRAGTDGTQHYFTLEPASQPAGATATVVATLGSGAMTVAPRNASDKAQRFTFGVAPGVYTIADASTGKLVGETDFDAVNGSPLALGAASGQPSQQWRVADGPDGSFKLVNLASGLCMDVTGASTAEGTTIERYACDPNSANQSNELWSAVGQADGIALVAKVSGQVLSRQNNGLVQRGDDDDKGQRWNLNRASAPVTVGGNYAIQAVSGTGWGERRTLDVTAGAPALNATSAAATQQWKLADAGGGKVEIYSRNAGTCLTPAASGAVTLSACDDGAGVWRADRRADGTYALTNTGTGGGVLTAGSGTALSVAADQGGAAQSWLLAGRPVTMAAGKQRLGTSVPFGAAGFVVTAFDAAQKPITGTLTADNKETIPAPSWPAAYVTNGTRVAEGENLGLLLQGLAKQTGATVLIQTVGRPQPGEGWDDIATGIKDLGGDPSVLRQLNGTGDYALVGCAGCPQATTFDEASRRASDPNLIGARLQGSLARNANSTYAAEAGSGVPIDSSLGALLARPATPWPFTDTTAGKAALAAIAAGIPLTASCDDAADLDPVRNSYCLQDVKAQTNWKGYLTALGKLPQPDGVDAATWASVKAQMQVEWTYLDNIDASLTSLASIYSSVGSGADAQSTGKAIGGLIHSDLNQPPPARDVTGDVLNIISDTMQLIGSAGPLLAAEPTPEPDPETGSFSEALLGLLSEAWTLAAKDDGATDAAGNAIQSQAADYAMILDQQAAKAADDLVVVENALVSDPVRLAVAGNNTEQGWTLPAGPYTDAKNDLQSGLARSLWTKLLPAAYDVYQFPQLPSGVSLQSMRCNGHPTFAKQPAAAVFSTPTSFNGLGQVTSGVTLTLSAKSAQGGDDLTYARQVGTAVTNPLFGVPAAGTPNGGFSARELIGQTGIDVRDQTAKQPAGNTPIFSCFVFDAANTHSWEYDLKSKNWAQAR